MVKKTPGGDFSQGPEAPSAHRRPGYSLSGCTPAEPDSASPGNSNFTLASERHNQIRGFESEVRQDPRQDRERDSGCIPGSDMAHCDAAGVNGSNRTFFIAPRLGGRCRM